MSDKRYDFSDPKNRLTPKQAFRMNCIECMGGIPRISRKKMTVACGTEKVGGVDLECLDAIRDCSSGHCIGVHYMPRGHRATVKGCRNYCLSCNGVKVIDNHLLDRSDPCYGEFRKAAKTCTHNWCPFYPYRPGHKICRVDERGNLIVSPRKGLKVPSSSAMRVKKGEKKGVEPSKKAQVTEGVADDED